ncbi:hypothetical protein MMC17_009776, partial [Xylographa soralifera]|nr:hypothetical protein [Xylographa soralifera]
FTVVGDLRQKLGAHPEIRQTLIIKVVLLKVPFLLQTAASHTLGLSSTSSKWDLKTELIVKFIRSLMTSPEPTPIGKQQRMTLKDPGIKGPIWISKITVSIPEEDDASKALNNAIDALKEGGEVPPPAIIAPVEAEWTGYRAGVDKHRHRLDLSEAQHYDRLMQEVTSDITVLYFHGGALFLMDPASHRPTCMRLAKMTGGRCLSVRYRLAPKHAFPAALLDALIAYLYLLSPPPGSYHDPIPAKHIVFAGDSAGGNLCMALLQFILQSHRASPSKTPTIRFHGRDVEIPLPAGVAPNSGWMDLTRCMPSIYANSHYDYLPAPPSEDMIKHFPKDDLWPTDPPRGDLYCETSMLCHPLVSPLAAKDWKGTCPVWLAYGTECLTDEGRIVARRMAQQAGTVIWQEYEAMPHCFSLIFEHLPGGVKCFESWVQFMKDVVEGRSIETHGLFVAAKSLKETGVTVTNLLGNLSDKDVDELMREARVKRSTGEEGEAKLLPRL